MEKNTDDYTVLRTYRSMWKYERKIYSLENIRLLIPVRPSEVLFFSIGLLITYLLCKVVPFLNEVPFVFRYILFPFGIMKFLTKKRFDGKMPHRFFVGYITYRLMPSKIARFKPVRTPRSICFTPVVFRHPKVLNLTEMALSEKGKDYDKRKKFVRFSG